MNGVLFACRNGFNRHHNQIIPVERNHDQNNALLKITYPKRVEHDHRGSIRQDFSCNERWRSEHLTEPGEWKPIDESRMNNTTHCFDVDGGHDRTKHDQLSRTGDSHNYYRTYQFRRRSILRLGLGMARVIRLPIAIIVVRTMNCVSQRCKTILNERGRMPITLLIHMRPTDHNGMVRLNQNICLLPPHPPPHPFIMTGPPK
jgi:hypothetical protein